MAIFEPEAGIAAGRCLAARVRAASRPHALPITTQHPRPCAWCDWPLEALDAEVSGFNEWAGYSARSNTFAHHELRVWSELPHSVQEERITAAQGLAAMAETPAAPRHEDPPPQPVEEDIAWLT